MRLDIDYSLEESPEEKVRVSVGPGILMAWEMRTRSKVSEFGSGFSMTGLVGVLFEYFKQGDKLPEGVKTEKDLANRIYEIQPVNPGKEEADPTQKDQ